MWRLLLDRQVGAIDVVPGNAGTSLIARNIPSLRENWDGCALLVPPDSPAALKSAVQRLIEQPELRGELAAKARKRAGHLTPELMGTSYLKAYAQLLQRPELGASGGASAAVRPAKEHRRRAILCAS